MSVDEMATKEAAVVAPGDEALVRLRTVLAAADEMKAREVVTLDVRRQTILADFFVICSGTSNTHIKSIVENVQDHMRLAGGWRAKAEGDAASFWMVLDYHDVIVHVFSEETRTFYDLERLWADATVVEIPALAA